jgi:HAD superfamily hydrolase (TIGR01509 family)
VALPSAVLFDLFATLADEDFRSLVAEEAEFLGVSPSAFTAANEATRYARSRIPDALTGTRLILEHLQLDTTHAQSLYRMQADWLVANGRLYDDVMPTLQGLRNHGIKTAVICNGSGFIRPWLDVSGLGDTADLVMLSAEEGVAKPETEIFLRACDRLGARPNQLVWFVDDQPGYLAGANALGFRCWRIARPGTPVIDDTTYQVVADVRSVLSAVVPDDTRAGGTGPGELAARHQRLIDNLANVCDILQRIGAGPWLQWMEIDASRIESGDAEGLTHLLGAFGGMGSFNDLVVDPRNGHSVNDREAEQLDADLCRLRSFIWSDAQLLRAVDQVAPPPAP